MRRAHANRPDAAAAIVNRYVVRGDGGAGESAALPPVSSMQQRPPETALAGGFGPFLAAPAEPHRPMVRTYAHAGMHVESSSSRSMPDLQRKIYQESRRAPPFSGPTWGVGGDMPGKRRPEPPPALDAVRAQRRHFAGIHARSAAEFHIEDALSRKAHLLRDGARVSERRGASYTLETQMGAKVHLPPRLELGARDGRAPAGSRRTESVVYSTGYFKSGDGLTPSLDLGRRKYGPAGRENYDLLIRERPKGLSFVQRNALDTLRAERDLVGTLQTAYDEDACSPRRPATPPAEAVAAAAALIKPAKIAAKK